MLRFETQNKQIKQNQNVNVLIAGVAGVLAGATGISALALSDKDIRKRVGKRTKELKSSLEDWSTEKLQLLEKQRLENEESVERVIDEAKEDLPLQEIKMKN